MSAKLLTTVTGLLVGATVLAACGTGAPDGMHVGSIGTDYRQNHPIVVAEREHTLDIPVASGARELNVATRSNITAFATTFARSGTGVLQMLEPSGSANMHAVARVRSDILGAIERGGAPASDVAVLQYDASQHGSSAAVRLSFVGVTAATPKPCGVHTGDLGNTLQNKPHADFGCSVQSNMAAMIENPGDLLGPRDMSPIDATQRGAVIRDYQTGPRTGPTGEIQF